MVGPIEAVFLFFAKYVDFNGRSTRAEYWWVTMWSTLFTIIMGAAIIWNIVLMFSVSNWSWSGLLVPVVLMGLFLLVMIVPTIALHVRRYRDAGVNPLYVIVVFLAPAMIYIFAAIVGYVGNRSGFTSDHSLASMLGMSSGITLLSNVLRIFDLVITVLPGTDKQRF